MERNLHTGEYTLITHGACVSYVVPKSIIGPSFPCLSISDLLTRCSSSLRPQQLPSRTPADQLSSSLRCMLSVCVRHTNEPVLVDRWGRFTSSEKGF